MDGDVRSFPPRAHCSTPDPFLDRSSIAHQNKREEYKFAMLECNIMSFASKMCSFHWTVWWGRGFGGITSASIKVSLGDHNHQADGFRAFLFL